MSVKPRSIAHRGTVLASGFLIDVLALGEREARARALALWTPGTRIFGLERFIVVLGVEPKRVLCVASPGTPLVAAGDVLLAAPLTPGEIEAFGAPNGALIRIAGGIARADRLETLERLRPETWIDLSELQIAPVGSLGAPPAPPRLIAEPTTFDARERLGGMPPPAADLAKVIDSLRADAAAKRVTPTSTSHRASDLRIFGGRAIGWLAGAIARLGGSRRREVGGAGTDSRAEAISVGPAGPSLADRLLARLHRLAARLLIAARLQELVTRRQAEYLVRMVEMFESGDLREALRYAIPLGSLEGAFNLPSTPALGLPSARTSLDIVPALGGAARSIGLGDDMFQELRRMYRAAFEKLEAQGRIEEAAFVLAELLQANEEVVSFLERHERMRLAAEIAEARGLPAGLVVRQWFLAGDVPRAVALARRTGAFAHAVVLLERTDKKRGEVLRLLWAGTLADAGNYAAAAGVVMTIPSARGLESTWAERAVAAGGRTGGAMLARVLAFSPEKYEWVCEQALALFELDDAVAARAAFAEGLRKLTVTPQAQALARATARCLLRDAAGESPHAAPMGEIRKLVRYSGDGAMRADLPATPDTTRVPLADGTRPILFDVQAHDAGMTPILDAAFLPSGRTLVALGEAGARLLSRDGRTVASFDEPAHRLVPSERGDRAILLAPRGEVWRLAKVDLLDRTCDPWCDARIDAWSADYDGELWFLAARDDFYAIDATSKRFDAMWRVPDVEGSPVAVTRSSLAVRFVMSPSGQDDWLYQLPQLELRKRGPAMSRPEDADSERLIAALPQGTVAELAAPDEAPCRPMLRVSFDGLLRRELEVGSIGDRPAALALRDEWLAYAIVGGDGASVVLAHDRIGSNLATIGLGGATRVSLRFGDETLAIADDRGRLIVIDLQIGRVVRDLRI